MHIVGNEFWVILAPQEAAVEVHASTRKLVARASPAEALSIVSRGFAGVDNRRQIHDRNELRPARRQRSGPAFQHSILATCYSNRQSRVGIHPLRKKGEPHA